MSHKEKIMSRSYKHTPITGYTTSESEKEDKRIWHGALRAAEREFLATVSIDSSDDDALIAPIEDNIASPWDFAKDGKKILDLKNPESLKYMRK